MGVSLLDFTPVSGPLLVGFLSRSSATLSGSLRSGILWENHSDILSFSYQDRFVNNYDNDSCIKSVQFPPY